MMEEKADVDIAANVVDVIEEEVIEYKVYKEKPYLNSDRDPLGISLNGKSKEYIHAHGEVKNILKKGKQYSLLVGYMKILDVINNMANSNAIIEVDAEGEAKGNVELKIHAPSVHKKKGATIEIRKVSGFEYSQVLILRKIITCLLDNFIKGNDISDVVSNSEKLSSKSRISQVTSKPTLFTCDLCKWQTRFPSALKTHKTRIHQITERDQTKKLACGRCMFRTTK